MLINETPLLELIPLADRGIENQGASGYNSHALRRGRSSVWLERWPVTPEVASSSLVGPAIICPCSPQENYKLAISPR